MTSQGKAQRRRGTESHSEVRMSKCEVNRKDTKAERKTSRREPELSAFAISNLSTLSSCCVLRHSHFVLRPSHFVSLWLCVSEVCLSISFLSLQKERDLD